MARESDDPLISGELGDELSRRWSLERGLPTYEEGLRLLAAREVVAEETYRGIRSLGGFRNVLAHEYLDIDLDEVIRWRSRVLESLPTWTGEVAAWLDRVEVQEP